MKYEIGLLKIPVKDISLSVPFYEEHLHFKKEFVAEKYGWAQFSVGDLSIALYVPGKGGGTSQTGRSLDFHLTLPKDGFSDLASKLLESGHLSEDMIHTGNDDTKFIDVVDPDRNLLKIMQCD
jgi:hypothetical protein